MKRFLAVVLLGMSAWTAFAAEEPAVLRLWSGDAPGSEGRTAPDKILVSGGGERQVVQVDVPTITCFLPAKEAANGAAVLVIPGGGHRMLCIDHEGDLVAKRLVSHGVAAFVLHYRLARAENSPYTILDHAVPDTRRALRLIRSRAGEWGIDPARLGAIGFSAGGELVAQAAMHPSAADAAAADPLEHFDGTPAFQGLIYPGRSGDIQPVKGAPPAFLLCGEKDRQDIAEGLAETYLRFKRAEVPAELHIYSGVGHGFGFRPTDRGPVAEWPERFVEWLEKSGFLKKNS